MKGRPFRFQREPGDAAMAEIKAKALNAAEPVHLAEKAVAALREGMNAGTITEGEATQRAVALVTALGMATKPALALARKWLKIGEPRHD